MDSELDSELDLSKIGKRFTFNYPVEFVTLPEYTFRAGQVVTVIRPLTIEEAEQQGPDMEGMWLIRADDGWEGHAWDSELGDCVDSETAE